MNLVRLMVQTFMSAIVLTMAVAYLMLEFGPLHCFLAVLATIVGAIGLYGMDDGGES